MTAILGVHGVGNDRPLLSDDAAADALAGIWATALSTGLPVSAAVDLRVAYYAPQLRSEVAQGVYDPDALDPRTRAMVRAWLDLLDPPTEVAAGPGTAPLRHALEWVAEHFGLDNALTRVFSTVFFREVGTYLDPTNTYPRVRSRNVFLTAFAAHRPRVVIAHSLGSVVAYEALWARPDLTLDLLLTVGSPLGMPDVVFPRIEPSTSPTGGGHRPPGVRTWVNVADVGDLVAIPRRLSGRFRDIEDDLTDTVHAFDFHKVVNYLKCPQTISTITPYLD